MRGVMEEKTNRIAEVMVSSVRPFELMMGKITGIGAVGLTQFLLWIVLLGAIGFIAQGVIPHDMPGKRMSSRHGRPGRWGDLPLGRRRRGSIFRQFHCQHQYGADHFLLSLLFHRGLSLLFGLVRGCGQCCQRRSTGSAIADATDHPACHFLLCYYVCRRTGPGRSAGGMGQHHSFQLADRYDGQDSVWGTRHCSLVATGPLHAVAGPWVFGHNLAGRKDLPDRHPAVRQEAQLEAHVEVGLPAALRLSVPVSVRDEW